jgi:hypothetical protein
MTDQEGPQMREIPSQRQRVCGDCKYHKKDRWMCGHDHVTDNYSCTHPEFTNPANPNIVMGGGRQIAFNSRETPSTPSWCPFLKQ